MRTNIVQAYLDRFQRLVVLVTHMSGVDARSIVEDVNTDLGFKILEGDDVNAKLLDLERESQRTLDQQVSKFHYGMGVFVIAPVNSKLTLPVNLHVHLALGPREFAAKNALADQAAFQKELSLVPKTVNKFINIKADSDRSQLGDKLFDTVIEHVKKRLEKTDRQKGGVRISNTRTAVHTRFGVRRMCTTYAMQGDESLHR